MRSPGRPVGSRAARSRAAIASETREVTISGRTFPYFFWDGQTLAAGCLGLDTETALITDGGVPALALASASTGAEHCLIHPDRLGEFVLAHKDRHLVFHNVAFDFWVVAGHLAARGETEALDAWWAAADSDRMHDTMLLDGLIRLARTGAHPHPRDLGIVAREYAGMEVDKLDPYRLRYAETVGRDWAAVERGFFDYAVKDPIVTLAAYHAMREAAAALMEDHGVNDSDAAGRFGPLSEGVQVKGAVALARISHHGMRLDVERLEGTRAGLERRLEGQLDELLREPAYQGLLRLDGRGQVVLTEKGRTPSVSNGRLRELLERAAGEVAAESGRPAMIPRTAKGKTSFKTGDWEYLAPFHPLVHAWIELGKTTKLLQFCRGLDGPVVHPRYTTMVRTGRTSCSGPNVQNLPRKGGLREAFVASPGHLLLTVDYAFIELRTLAAVCEARYGASTLAEVIRAGTDPHCHTAAMLEGVTLEEFMALKAGGRVEDREKFDTLRQRAKVVNFGIPGGLGSGALVAYAKSTYGVSLTPGEAGEFRRRLIEEVYPELGLYLADDGMEALARNLRVPVAACWQKFDWSGGRSGAVAGGVRNVIMGKTHKSDGTPYNPRYLADVWGGLVALNRDAELSPLLSGRLGSESLAKRLFSSGVTTLTGRVRGRVGFTQARNTPFQGLAADGAKLALWALVKAGYRVVAFVHDEVLIELPEGADHTAEALRVEGIMNRSMGSVTGDVPVACEYALSRRWSKQAKAVFPNGRLVPCEIPAS